MAAAGDGASLMSHSVDPAADVGGPSLLGEAVVGVWLPGSVLLEFTAVKSPSAGTGEGRCCFSSAAAEAGAAHVLMPAAAGSGSTTAERRPVHRPMASVATFKSDLSCRHVSTTAAASADRPLVRR